MLHAQPSLCTAAEGLCAVVHQINDAVVGHATACHTGQEHCCAVDVECQFHMLVCCCCCCCLPSMPPHFLQYTALLQCYSGCAQRWCAPDGIEGWQRPTYPTTAPVNTCPASRSHKTRPPHPWPPAQPVTNPLRQTKNIQPSDAARALGCTEQGVCSAQTLTISSTV